MCACSRRVTARFLRARMIRMFHRRLGATRQLLRAVDAFLNEHGIEGKTAIVTGGSRGIGREIVKMLAAKKTC